MKGVHFKKKLSMTKKRSSEILDDRRTFFKICQRFGIWSENKLSPNFCPPIFMTSIRLWLCTP